jgi:hypothetical protein
MDIFISWSGDRSRAVAKLLHQWLPIIINAANPFLSIADIDKGARWSSEIAGQLEKARAGVICLTPMNIDSQWILFEAGALSKTIKNTFVCPLLIGLKPSDIKGPLAQFQFATTDKADMLRLFKTLNSAQEDQALSEGNLETAFSLVWPKFEEQLKGIPLEETQISLHRSERELLEEVLELVRSLGRVLPAEIQRLLDSRDHSSILQEIQQWVSDFLAKQGDGLKGGAFHRVQPDQYEISVWTESDLELSRTFPVSLPRDELISKVRHWFVERYKTRRRRSPDDIYDLSDTPGTN